MRVFITLLLAFSTTVMAEVSREEARNMIDEMVKSNMISAEEAEKAKARLTNMNAQDWSKLNKEAEEKAARMPASVSVGDPSMDINQEQFSAIESDLKVIAPEVVIPKVHEPVVDIPKVHLPQVQIPVVHIPNAMAQGHN